MKDALGHGSNPHGAHADAIHKLPRGLKVERNDFKQARTPQGQVDTRVKQVWNKVSGPKRRAVAERIALLSRIDNPNSLHRVR